MIKWSKEKQYWFDFATYAGLVVLLGMLVTALYGFVVITLAMVAVLL